MQESLILRVMQSITEFEIAFLPYFSPMFYFEVYLE